MRTMMATGVLLAAAIFAARVAPAQSSRPGWAATPYADTLGTGVTFRVWAPNATNVAVGGTFNGWSSSAHPLGLEGASGIWSADVADAGVGDSYSYVINGVHWRQDPRGQLFDTSNTKNPQIMSTNAFDWGGTTNPVRSLNELIIYEMHPGTFHDPVTNDTAVGTLSGAVERLDYVKDLGFNTVQLMPVNEYPGDTSWGYNPIYLHSVARPYGGPDGLKAFVKACHERGLTVLLDVVHNHWGPKTDKWGLWQTDAWAPDPTYGGLYFYNTAALATTPWGVTRPNFGEQGVRDYIMDSFTLFLEEYRIDGFRWDTPYHIARDNNGSTIADGESLVAEIIAETSSNFSHVIHIGENAEFLSVFDGHWDHTPSKEMGLELVKSNDIDRNMFDIEAFILPDPSVTHVRYSESHDLVGGLNNRTRIPSQIDPADPFSYNARKKSALGGILTFTCESVPMVFQGQCMYETYHFSSRYPVVWEYTNTHSETVTMYRDIIGLRRNASGVTGGLEGDETDLLLLEHTDKVTAFRRGDGDARQDCIVIANLSSNTLTDYDVPLPEGMWFTHFNSDDSAYGVDYSNTGSRMVFAPRNPTHEAKATVAPYSVLVMSRLNGDVNLIDAVLDDNTDGNGNVQVDPAEIIRDYPVLYNLGDTAISNVRVTVTSPHEDLVIVSNEVFFSSLGSGETKTNAACFVYRTERSLPCGTPLVFPVVMEPEGSAPITSYYGRLVGELLDCATNSGPVILDAGLTVVADTWTNGSLALFDAEGDDIRVERLLPAEHGAFSLNTNTGGYGYQPIRGYSGTDRVDLVAHDLYGPGPVTNLGILIQPRPDTDGDGLPDYWEQLYFGNPTNAQPYGHGDGDQVDNRSEYLAGTIPNDSTSYCRIMDLGPTGDGENMVVLWWGAGGVRYRVETSTNPPSGFFGEADTPEAEMVVAPSYMGPVYRIVPLNIDAASHRIHVITE